jgi:hypothetical protein
VCCLKNTTTSPIVCLLLASPSCLSNAHVVCMAMAVQDLPGDGASKVVFKIYVATALSSSVLRRQSSLHDGSNEESGGGGSRSSFQPFFHAHTSTHYQLPLFPALY